MPSNNTNAYAGGVKFGEKVSPFAPLLAAGATAAFAYYGDGDAIKGMNKLGSQATQLVAPIITPVTNKIIDGADVIANVTGLTESGNTPVRNALTATRNAYEKYIPEASRDIIGAGLLTMGTAELGLVPAPKPATTSVETF